MKGKGIFISHISMTKQTKSTDFPSGVVTCEALGDFEVRKTPALYMLAVAVKRQDSHVDNV